MRAVWLCGAAALSSAAFAGDRPADDAGAKAIADFLGAYAGKAALPSVKIASEGSAYRVTVDMGAAAAAMKPAGFVYDQASISFKVFQQNDGEWRVEVDQIPPMTAHVTPPPGQANAVKLDVRVETVNPKSVTLIDPKLNWIASVHGGADEINVKETGPGIEENIQIGGLNFDGKTTSGSAGLITTMHQPWRSLAFAVDIDSRRVAHATRGPLKPVHFSGHGEGGAGDVSLADFQPQPLLDAWRFAVAHPERSDVARDFETLKTVLRALSTDHLKINEKAALDKLTIMTEGGPIGLEGISFEVGAANMGVSSGGYERVAARAITLPDSLAPPMYGPFIPSSFQLGVKATGIDIEAAVQEWLADAKLDGDGPMLSKEDQDKVTNKLIGGRPIVFEIGPSLVKAPALDLSFLGALTLDKGERTGVLTVTLRDFAKTEQAVQALPPPLATQATQMIGMAKGLATTQPDGSLVWVLSLGHDRMIKVNGLPLSKSPL